MDSQATISERADDVQLSIRNSSNTTKERNSEDHEVEGISAILAAVEKCTCQKGWMVL